MGVNSRVFQTPELRKHNKGKESVLGEATQKGLSLTQNKSLFSGRYCAYPKFPMTSYFFFMLRCVGRQRLFGTTLASSGLRVDNAKGCGVWRVRSASGLGSFDLYAYRQNQ